MLVTTCAASEPATLPPKPPAIYRVGTLVLNLDLERRQVLQYLTTADDPPHQPVVVPDSAVVLVARSEGHMITCKNVAGRARYGVTRQDGSEIIPHVYDKIAGLNQGRLTLRKETAYGVVDLEGNWIVPLGRYAYIGTYEEDVCVVATAEGKFGFLDRGGELLIKSSFDAAGGFSCGRSLVRSEGSQSFIDQRGVLLYSAREHEHLWDFVECLARVQHEIPSPLEALELPPQQVSWFVTRDGVVAIPPRPWSYGDFEEGLAPAAEGVPGTFTSRNSQYVPNVTADGRPIRGRWGFIDKQGRLAIPMIFDEVRGFAEGRARVRIDSKWGFVDASGTMIVQAAYALAEDFYEGIAVVCRADLEMIVIDRSGAVLIETGLEHPGIF